MLISGKKGHRHVLWTTMHINYTNNSSLLQQISIYSTRV